MTIYQLQRTGKTRIFPAGKVLDAEITIAGLVLLLDHLAARMEEAARGTEIDPARDPRALICDDLGRRALQLRILSAEARTLKAGDRTSFLDRVAGLLAQINDEG